MTASTAKSVYSHLAAPACYDPDEAFPRESPQMSSFRPKIAPSPSPPPRMPPAGPASSRGDAVLLEYLNNGSRPQLAARDSSYRPLQSSLSDTDSVDEPSSISCPSPSSTSGRSPGTAMPGMSPRSNESDSLDLKVLAAGALAFSTTSQGPPQSKQQSERSRASTRNEGDAANFSAPGEGGRRLAALERPPQFKDQSLMRATPTSLRSGQDFFSKKLDIPHVQHIETVSPPSPKLTASQAQHIESTSPTSPRQPGSGGLPPLQMESPTSEANANGHGQALPSIRQHFSDLALSPDNRAASMGRTPSFSCSPPTSLPGISAMTSFHGGRCSPPIPPSEAFRRGLPSPQSLNSFGYYYFSGNHRMPGDQGSCTADTPSSDQSSTGPSNAGLDRVSADGSISSQPGSYVCTVSGCTAAPFQTQYLLNSHANVHSSARPHYCPVDGCPRGEGGMGFKRKNEMIRHGLVHESPGYVCPFCPDREHRYPRPDNLQRHVRVHHVDKDKDDPLLRDVLSQRPDGPSRGRRRRGVTS